MACARLVAFIAVSMLIPPIAGSQSPPPSPQSPPPRDTPAMMAGTGVLRGSVRAAATGDPLHRVRITLNGTAPNLPSAVTDTRGAFELTGVPAGTYSISAARAGYLPMQYGQRQPRQAGRSVIVSDGQIVDDLNILLPRGGVLAGRVFDELGEPLAGARVEAVELRYLRGRRIAVAAQIASTNDEGDYRLASLEPGHYQVRASSTDVWEADDGRTQHAYAVTYYPGVTGAVGPQSLKVSAGEQIDALDFRLVASRASRITGAVESATGEPLAGQIVRVSPIGRTIGGALLSSGPGPQARTDGRGSFEFKGLAPGEYLVYTGGPKETASRTVLLDHAALEHVVLTPRPPAMVTGTIVTDEGTAPAFPAARLRMEPIPADPARVLHEWGGPSTAVARPDWTFRIGDMDGDYLLRVAGLPDDWMLASVLVRGRDVVDSPLRVVRGSSPLEGVQVVLSRKGARLSGDVSDGRGAEVPDATVVVFADDAARWGPGSRFVQAVRPDRRGHFAAASLPPGLYRIAARLDIVAGQWEDVEFLETLRRDAVKIELAEGASETIKLTLEPVK